MTVDTDTKRIFRALNKAGFTTEYVRSTLPDWWDDAVNQNPVGLAEFKLLLARNLGLDISSLSGSEPRLKFELPHVRKLKRAKHYSEIELTPAVSVALSVGRIAIAACPAPQHSLPDALTFRDYILAHISKKSVSLKSLVMACWHFGLPVIHVNNYPDGVPKMDGIAAVIKDRPVIVLSKLTPYSAWMSFILAHEIGHLALGHCNNGELIIDEDFESTNGVGHPQDNEEKSADRYALDLLGGTDEIDARIDPGMTLHEMVHEAMIVQRETNVDAGHVLLRHAFKYNNWKNALAALRSFDKNDPIKTLKQGSLQYLKIDQISESSREFLFQMSGLDNDHG